MDLHAELRHRLDAFRDRLGGDLTAPIRACPGWTLHDLADHLGNENTWITTAVREGHPTLTWTGDRSVLNTALVP